MTTLQQNLYLIKKYNLTHGDIDLQQAPKCKNCRNVCQKCKFNYFMNQVSKKEVSTGSDILNRV